MLYEVALLPDSFDPATHAADHGRSLALKEVLRGLAQNGLLANLHKRGLLKHADEHIEQLPPKVRQDVRSLLETLYKRNRVVRRPKQGPDPESDIDWLSLAAKTDNLFAIVTNTPSNVDSDRLISRVLELNTVLDSELWTSRKNTCRVSMDEQGYRTALAPLLRYANKVLLIDPYLDAKQSFEPIVKLCSILLGKGKGTSQGTIQIHTCERETHRFSDEDVEAWRSQWRGLLAPLHASYGHRYQVFLYRKPREGQRFHDRFILTDQCGVSVSGGLGVVKGSQTDWHLMDYELANKHRADFERPVHPYLEIAAGCLSIP